jgi:hypothetical protein
MTLTELNRLTAHLPGESEIKILSPWGEIEDAALITAADLADDDPLRDAIHPTFILLATEAS